MGIYFPFDISSILNSISYLFLQNFIILFSNISVQLNGSMCSHFYLKIKNIFIFKFRLYFIQCIWLFNLIYIFILDAENFSNTAQRHYFNCCSNSCCIMKKRCSLGENYSYKTFMINKGNNFYRTPYKHLSSILFPISQFYTNKLKECVYRIKLK